MYAGRLLVTLGSLGLVLLLEDLLHRLASLNTIGFRQRILIHSLLQVDVNRVSDEGGEHKSVCNKATEESGGGVPGGHNVIEVDNLDERLDLGPLLHLLLAHRTNDLARVSVDARD